MTPPSKSSKLQIVGRGTSVTYLRLEAGIGWMDSMSITDLHKIRSWSLSGEARPPWPLLPVIDGSHLGNLGITRKRF